MTAEQVSKRLERLAPMNAAGERVPRYIRCYDNGGETLDQYTVVYTRTHLTLGTERYYTSVSMNELPFYPSGICQHGEHPRLIDRPTSTHLGKRIPFDALPSDCKRAVLRDYADIWDLPGLIEDRR